MLNDVASQTPGVSTVPLVTVVLVPERAVTVVIRLL
jgi:hypothetical protein